MCRSAFYSWLYTRLCLPSYCLLNKRKLPVHTKTVGLKEMYMMGPCSSSRYKCRSLNYNPGRYFIVTRNHCPEDSAAHRKMAQPTPVKSWSYWKPLLEVETQCSRQLFREDVSVQGRFGTQMLVYQRFVHTRRVITLPNYTESSVRFHPRASGVGRIRPVPNSSASGSYVGVACRKQCAHGIILLL